MKTRSFLRKKSFYIMIILLMLSLGFCSNTSMPSKDNTQSKGRTTIVFIDKTLSTAVDSIVEQKNQFWMKKIIKENVLQRGDKLILSYIYENTASPTNIFEYTYQPPKPSERQMSSSEARIEKVKYSKRLRAYKKSFTEKTLQKAFSHEANRKSTDVVGSIKLLADISKSNDGSSIKVFYLSDMLECSMFRYLDFGNPKGSTTSFEQAQSLGKKDVPRILKRYQLTNDCLKNISEITIIFPATEMDANKAFTLLPEYWNVVFKSVGISTIHYY